MKLKQNITLMIKIPGKLNRNQNASVRWGTGSHKSKKDYTRKTKHKNRSDYDGVVFFNINKIIHV